MSAYHQTVLLRETVDALSVKDGGIYVDCTAGGGGHTAEILRRMQGGRVIAIDRDPDAIAYLSERFRDEPRVTLVHDEYRHIASILSSLAVPPVDGVVADLGISGKHVDDPERGVAALADNARSIARNIVISRKKQPITRTLELVDIIKRSMPQKAMQHAHPAKRTFQALRIAVNGELDSLQESVNQMFQSLAVGGSLAIITFHSLEDKIVKGCFTEFCRGCICPPDFPVCVCHRTPRGKLKFRSVTPSAEELEENNRARSARLRAVEKLK